MKKRLTHRLCMPGYARLVRSLIDKPATTEELAQRMDVTPSVMRGITRRMHAQRIIRIHGWRRPKQGPMMRVFGFGSDPDAPRPLCATGLPSRHIGATRPPPRPTSEITAFASLLDGLSEERSRDELAEFTGLTRPTIFRNIKNMRDLGLVYISGWERRLYVGGKPIPLFRFGIDKRNAEKPKVATKVERNLRYNTARRELRAQMRFTHAVVLGAAAPEIRSVRA